MENAKEKKRKSRKNIYLLGKQISRYPYFSSTISLLSFFSVLFRFYLRNQSCFCDVVHSTERRLDIYLSICMRCDIISCWNSVELFTPSSFPITFLPGTYLVPSSWSRLTDCSQKKGGEAHALLITKRCNWIIRVTVPVPRVEWWDIYATWRWRYICFCAVVEYISGPVWIWLTN